jgi:Ca2+-binding EF-hand superfamily protein
MIAKNINDETNIKFSIEAFGIFDKGRTEKINKGIVKELLMTKDISHPELDFNEQEIEEIFKHIEIDNNDMINYTDIVKSTFDIFSTNDV